MELERDIRAINRETINPVIPELTLEGLRPFLRLVALARARYLEAVVGLGDRKPDGRLEPDQLSHLEELRREYNELSAAAQALETAIQRGYLDVQASR